MNHTEIMEIPIASVPDSSISDTFWQGFIALVYIVLFSWWLRTPDISREYAQNLEEANQQIIEDYEWAKDVSVTFEDYLEKRCR